MSDTTPIYLIDENGDYITDELGNKILIGEVANLELATEEDIRKGLRLARRDVRSIKKFEILYDNSTQTYYTKFNNHKMGGRFDSVGVAYGQVLGTYIQNGSTDELAQALDSLAVDPYLYVSGQADILAELKNSNAKVAFFGDSISNNAGTLFATFFQSALFAWKPTAWKGAWFNTQGGTGVWGSSSGAATTENVMPGMGADLISLTAPGFDHTQASYMKVGEKGGTTGFIASPAFRLNSLSPTDADRSSGIFSADYPNGREIFTEASGSRSIATSTNDVVMGLRSLLPNGKSTTNYDNSTGLGFQYIAYNPGSSSNSGLRSDELTVTGESGNFSVEAIYTQTPPESGVDYDGTGAPGGQVWQTQWRHNGGSGWYAFDGHFWGGTDDGMTISYFGNGGWTLKNHLDGESSEISGITDDWHYSDEYLEARLEAEEATHAFIFLGENDMSGSTTTTAEESFDDIKAVRQRIRDTKPGIKFIILTIYQVGSDDITKAAEKVVFNNYLKDLNDADTVIVDLAGYINDSWDTQADFQNNWLDVDAVPPDTTHPNGEGAIAMMDWFWGRVEQVDSGVSDIGANWDDIVLFNSTVDSPNGQFGLPFLNVSGSVNWAGRNGGTNDVNIRGNDSPDALRLFLVAADRDKALAEYSQYRIYNVSKNLYYDVTASVFSTDRIDFSSVIEDLWFNGDGYALQGVKV